MTGKWYVVAPRTASTGEAQPPSSITGINLNADTRGSAPEVPLAHPRVDCLTLAEPKPFHPVLQHRAIVVLAASIVGRVPSASRVGTDPSYRAWAELTLVSSQPSPFEPDANVRPQGASCSYIEGHSGTDPFLMKPSACTDRRALCAVAEPQAGTESRCDRRSPA